MDPDDIRVIRKALLRFEQVIGRWENNYVAVPNDKKNLRLALDALEKYR